MITDFKVNQEILDFFFVPEAPLVRQTKKDKDYLCLKLQDKTGNIDARVWDYPVGFNPDSIKKGSFVKIRGSVSEWNDVKQVVITLIRLAEAGDNLDIGNFFEKSVRSSEDMLDELTGLLQDNMDTDGHAYELVGRIIGNNIEQFKIAPAAKGVHHAYLGGLLEHVLSMCHAAVPICKHYQLRTDEVIAACVLHDIGKIRELTYPIGIGYSLEGTLIGHISIGMQMVADEIRQIPNFPEELKMVILHLIASHHGLLEYGSPKVPLMKEAIALNMIDSLDAKIAICNRAIKLGIDEQGLTAFVKELSGPLYKKPEES